MFDALEGVIRFLNSYPIWAKASVVGALIFVASVLVFAPRNEALTQSQQHAVLTILGVERIDRSGLIAVQIDVHVNGQTFRYPSLAGVEWAEAGPEMSKQSFKLPLQNRYEVRFEMRMKLTDDPRAGQMASQQTVVVTQLPFTSSYPLYEVHGATRRAARSAAVRFSIERD